MATADVNFKAVQKPYKTNCDRVIQTTPSFDVEQPVFLNRLSKEAASDEVRRKLLPTSVGSYKVLHATHETATLDEDSITNTVSLH